MAEYIYTCLDCDFSEIKCRPQRGVRCKPCARIHQGKVKKDTFKTTCACGKPKSYRAIGCQDCRDQSGERNGMFGKKNPSLSKRNTERKPEEHWNWKGGHNSKRDAKTISWSNKVRVVGACGCCGFSNPLALDAHHMYGYDLYPNLRYDVSNGVCLCKNCHTLFHKTHGYGNNTKEQYLEFKENYNG